MPIVIFYNKEMENPPQTWEDLLDKDERWPMPSSWHSVGPDADDRVVVDGGVVQGVGIGDWRTDRGRIQQGSPGAGIDRCMHEETCRGTGCEIDRLIDLVEIAGFTFRPACTLGPAFEDRQGVVVCRRDQQSGSVG